MWIRILVEGEPSVWHIVMTNEDNAYATMCGEYTKDWHRTYVVEARYTTPLVEDTCGWCLAKMMEISA